MDLSNETREKIRMVKTYLKSECKYISKMIKLKIEKNPPLLAAFQKIMDDGIITGSSFYHYFFANQEKEHDFDIFVRWDENEFKMFNDGMKSLLGNDCVTTSFNDEYKTISNAKESMKINIGNLSQMVLNIIFVEKLNSPELLVSNFDFEICNWYYKHSIQVLYATPRCIELISKKELDYTSNYKQNILNKLQESGPDKEHFFETMKSRLGKYINGKKFVMTDTMKETIEYTNNHFMEPIWSI